MGRSFSALRFQLLLAFFCLLLFFPAEGQVSDFSATNFHRADSVARRYAGHSLRDLKMLSHKLTQGLSSEQEKFRAIYKWVADNIEYDYELYLESKNARSEIQSEAAFTAWNARFRSGMFDKLFRKRRTVCTGYAYLIVKLSGHAGIRSVIVDGYCRTSDVNIGGEGVPNHSWNAVRLNNKWYLCDPTWSSGAIDVARRAFEPNFNNVYFLAEPSTFVRNHYPLDTAWTLMHSPPTLREFLDGPIIYSGFYQFGITRLFPTTFNVPAAKGERITFSFKPGKDGASKNIELITEGVGGRRRHVPQTYRNREGQMCIDYVFKSDGVRVIHIRMDERNVVSYRVVVGAAL